MLHALRPLRHKRAYCSIKGLLNRCVVRTPNGKADVETIHRRLRAANEALPAMEYDSSRAHPDLLEQPY
jgi:hypothetical protein